MAKLEYIECILMDIFSHHVTPPLPSPLPESTLPPVLIPSQSTSQLHVPASQPSVLLPQSLSHIPSESPVPSTSQHEYYSPCDIELLLDLDLPPPTVDTATATEYFNIINVFEIRRVVPERISVLTW